MLGALNLQQMVCLLPKSPDLEARFQRLVSKITEFGGEASLFTVTSPSKEWEDRIIAGFNKILSEAYAEVAENEERFQDEIRRETRKQKFTFTELEDMEADREKIHREMKKVQARDFFAAPGSREADARMAESRKLLEEFSRKVYEHEGVEGENDTENALMEPARKPPR